MGKDNMLRITDTTLRDGHQSLWATRMRTKDISGIIETIDQAGYYSLEVWGGATFDVCLRFLRENPWERLRLIKSKAKNTPLQMLLRGQNIVGYKNYPDDLVDRFVETAHHNGIDIFRIFDALNDTRNLEAAIKAVKRHGAHAQGALSYSISPVHTVDKYIQYAREQVQLGIDSLCIKDMAGILSPVQAKELVSRLTSELDIPVQLHCHATSGMAVATYLEGVMAGAGAIDCAIASMAGFSSQPPVESMIGIFRETDYQVNLDIEALRKINKYFTDLTPVRSKGRGFEPSIDSEILIHQIPGGMISNFRSQLEQQDALEKLPEALEEVTRVREDLGYPPLVTPTSQIVGTQAVMNVLSGERYKLVPEEIKKYVKGMYGRPPAPIAPKFIKMILGKEKPIDHRPADDLKPILPKATANVSKPELIKDEEDIISYCLFPEVAMEYFQWRATPEEVRPKSPADLEFDVLTNNSQAVVATPSQPETETSKEPMLHTEDYNAIQTILEKATQMHLTQLVISKGDFNLSLSSSANGGIKHAVQQENLHARQSVKSKEQEASGLPVAEQAPAAVATLPGETIDAIMAGTFYRAAEENAPPLSEEGSIVKKGDIICILEAMKLFNKIQAPFNCKIEKVLVENGSKVTKGQPLMAIEKL